MEHQKTQILALAGGVGGAKLALGLSRIVPPEHLTVVVNTGDDEEIHGLQISPDLDTVMYTLAGIENSATGWGRRDDTFAAINALKTLGGEGWFRLGDADIGTHLRRTELLHAGWSLSRVTAELSRRLGVRCSLAPMSDHRVRTVALTRDGPMSFQEYFVFHRCEPVLTGLRFDGADTAAPSQAFQDALHDSSMLVFCPSNPFVSVGPILALPGVRDAIRDFGGVRIAVSPIIGGQAVKGPAAKMFIELDEEPSALGVARRYQGLCDVFVLDEVDADLADAVSALGMQPLVAPALMVDVQDKIRLARQVLAAAGRA